MKYIQFDEPIFDKFVAVNIKTLINGQSIHKSSIM